MTPPIPLAPPPAPRLTTAELILKSRGLATETGELTLRLREAIRWLRETRQAILRDDGRPFEPLHRD